jgi:hypothetical protein
MALRRAFVHIRSRSRVSGWTAYSGFGGRRSNQPSYGRGVTR